VRSQKSEESLCCRSYFVVTFFCFKSLTNRNYSGSRFAPVMAHVNASIDYIERPLMTPDEVLRLKPSEKTADGTAERISAPGQMLIFVSGQHPILGTQMLYFLDPVLTARAAIPPPTSLLTLEDRRILPQPPFGRTRHEISKPEAVGDEEELRSAAAAGFFEELGIFEKE
jgi:type IV secretory pathway TraG/TraD family ATPase VirD4